MNYFLKNFLLFVICSLISVLGCESKKDKIKSQKNIVTQKAKKQPTKKDNFKLSDENVMEFFLEYDKHNKENRIRIYTDFGNIEIELFLDTKFHRSNFIFFIMFIIF